MFNESFDMHLLDLHRPNGSLIETNLFNSFTKYTNRLGEDGTLNHLNLPKFDNTIILHSDNCTPYKSHSSFSSSTTNSIRDETITISDEELIDFEFSAYENYSDHPQTLNGNYFLFCF